MEDLQQEDVEIQSICKFYYPAWSSKEEFKHKYIKISLIFILQIIFTRLQLKKKGEILGFFLSTVELFVF